MRFAQGAGLCDSPGKHSIGAVGANDVKSALCEHQGVLPGSACQVEHRTVVWKVAVDQNMDSLPELGDRGKVSE
jgi:hypothetical protein